MLELGGGGLSAAVCGVIPYAFHVGWISRIDPRIWACLVLGGIIGLGVAFDGLWRLLFGARGERPGTPNF